MEKNKKETSFTYGDMRNITVVLLCISVAYKIFDNLFIISIYYTTYFSNLMNDHLDFFNPLLGILTFLEWGALFFLLIWLITVSNAAHKNTDIEMKYGSFSTIGYWFVPIMNLYKPYDVYKEIWKVSSDLKASLSLIKTSKFYFISFALAIIVFALLRAFERQMGQDIINDNLAVIIIEFIRIVWYISIIRCIIELSKRQMDKWNLKDAEL